jgi:amino acid adenylation domain-containing protein/non-ribosomal peptide synthase protein (TIGR01720 family)
LLDGTGHSYYRVKKFLYSGRECLLAIKGKIMKKIYPLTPQQKGLWFEYLLDPQNGYYNIYSHYEITGALDEQKFLRSLRKLKQVFEIFRIRFVEVGDQICQEVVDHVSEDDLDYEDLSNPSFSGEELQQKALNLLKAKSLVPSQLLGGKLYRNILIKWAPNKFYFALCCHHIVSDGVSVKLFKDTLAEIYNSENFNVSDCAVIDNEGYWKFIESSPEHSIERKSASLAYWTEKLKQRDIWFDFGKAAVNAGSSVKFNTQTFEFGESLHSQIKAFCKKNATTPFLFLTGLFGILLHRYWGHKEVTLGYPVDLRPAGFQKAAGFYVTLFPLLLTIEPQQTVQEILRNITSQRRKGKNHQNVVWTEVSEALRHAGCENINFNIIIGSTFLIWEDGMPLRGLEVSNVANHAGSPPCDLSLLVNLSSAELGCYLSYNPAIFEEAFVRQLVAHFQHLIVQTLLDAEQKIADVPLLAVQEQEKFLIDWNKTAREYPHDKTLQALFEEQATKTPYHVAVVYEDKHLTYEELNKKANQLAHYLREQGVKPDSLAAIACERSLEMVIGILAILKAGGAYVPIDPSYPQERIQFMLEDTQALFLLTQQKVVSKLPTTVAKLLLLDKDMAANNYPTTNLSHTAQPHHLAYVIYTSGTTGKPKGVMIEHTSLCNRLFWYQSYTPLAQDDKFLHQLSFSFDAAVMALWWPLISGAQVVIASALKDMKSLADLVTSQAVTILHSTPTTIENLFDNSSMQGKSLTCLRKIISGGEPFTKKLYDKLSFLPACKFYNAYGPTEATIVATSYEINKEVAVLSAVPIGRPIANTQVYILDGSLNLAPVGVSGELYIGGVGLARGYLNQSELTAEKFIPNPFQTEEEKAQGKNARIYKTGDLCRWLEDGNIEYIGRSDEQVKIRGFRIELGEIEAALLQHPEIHSTVVMVREDAPGDKRLVGYIVPKEKALLEAAALRAHFQTILPDYMIPSAFVMLDEIPLTANGKLDHKALPAPEYRADEKAYIAPRTDMEKALCEIWQNVLRVEKVGVSDDFFHIGGDSIISIQLASKAYQKGISISVKDIFNHPTVASLALVAQNQKHPSELTPFTPIQHWFSEHGFAELGRKFGTHTQIEAVYPLSPMQSGLLFQALYKPDSDAYFVQSIFELEGEIDVAALRLAWQKVSKAHAALRTGLAWEGLETPLQYVLETIEIPFEVKDWKGLQKENKLEDFIQEDRKRKFDLEQAPLFRLTLIQWSETKYTLVWSQHHTLLDGWSIPIILGDVIKTYEALQRGKGVNLPARRPYLDYIAWLQKQENGEAEKFWKENLKDLEGPTTLSFKQLIEPKQGYETCSFGWSVEETRRIQQFAKEHGLTVNTLLQGAVGIALKTYTQKQEVVLGVTVSGRGIALSGVEEMTGLFINTLPLKMEVKGNGISFLKALQEQSRKIEEYAYPSLAQIQSWAGMPEGLFNVSYVFENYPLDPEIIQTSLGSAIKSSQEIGKVEYPLGVVGHLTELLCLKVIYQREHFDEKFIERFGQHLKVALQWLIERPAQLTELSLLTEKEEHQVLTVWNDTEKSFPKNKTVHQLFEQQVEKTPDNIAVVFEDASLTYHELNGKANQIARYLREQSVKPDDLVAIACERSLEMVIGILGILKAGGAFVPIDPSYPRERIQFILEDAQASLLLTQQKVFDHLPNMATKVLLLDSEGEIEGFPTNNLPNLTLPHHLAYVIYTSGTTGKPKGVMTEHRSILSCIAWHQDCMLLSVKDRLLHQLSFSFDPAVLCLWWPLLDGARVIIAPPLKDIGALAELIVNHQVTIFPTLPTILKSLIENVSIKGEKLNSLLQLLVGGESFSKELYERASSFLPGCRFYNVYGPTETTVTSIVCGVNKVKVPNTYSLPIGQPIANTQVYILDGFLNLVPVGVNGELYIGGVGLARGYLNQPELTTEKFIPNPFQTEEEKAQGKNARLYKTGDLCRWLEDGNIEYLGRCDDQVKIRGFRIELGEIEAALLQHPDIHSAVVIAQEDVPGNKRLVGYIVPKEKALLEIAALRAHLQTVLPEHMIPSAFVMLDEIPLTANGKLDRKALPAPEYRADEKAYIAPRTDMERALCEIWQNVLKVEKIGVSDNFFHIGGDSIISIQLVAKAYQRGISISVKDIFNDPTIASLALVAQDQKHLSGIMPEQGSAEGKVPLTPIQYWFFEQSFAEKDHFNQAVLLEVNRKLDLSLLNKALALLVEHHDALRLRYFQAREGWQQAYAQEHTEVICQSINLSDEEEFLTAVDRESTIVQQSLNIERGPIMKAVLFECRKNQHLLVVIHHLVVDGVSWRVLLEDLGKLYGQLASAEESSLPPKTHSYQQWAQALENYAVSEELTKELPYWKEVEETLCPLPVDFDKGREETSFSTLTESLAVEMTDKLLNQVPKAYRTQINEILLTALTLAMGDWTGNDELSLCLEGHGREEIISGIDLSRTVGWFTSMFPVYLRLEDRQDMGSCIKQIKETLRGVPHKGVGYGILKYLGGKQLASVSPGLGFNYLGQWNNTLPAEGWFKTVRHDSVGQSISVKNSVPTLININSMVSEGVLQLHWTYSTRHYAEATIQKLAQGFKGRLEELVDHCQGHFGYTPSDFPLASLHQEQLDRHFGTCAQIEAIYPLSPMQSGLLFQALYRPDSDAYFVQSIFEFEERIDLTAFHSAWQKVSKAHAALRTGLVWEGLETPLQYVLETIEIPLEIKDWRDSQEKRRLEAFIQEDRKRKFDLRQAPLLRLTLIQWSETKYTLVWSQHHILLDGWSLPVILGDVLRTYEALQQGKNINLPARRPYIDYIAWLQKQESEKAEKFWKEYLKGLEGPTQLSFKQLIEPKQGYEECFFNWSIEETKKIQQFAKGHGLTVNTILQGAVGIVLKTYTQKQEVVLGVTVSGRGITLPGVEEMTGLFINTLPLRMEVKGNGIPFLKAIQEQSRKIEEYAYSSLAQIQSWAGMSEGLFNISYIFENYPFDPAIVQSSLGSSIKSTRGVERTEYSLGIMGYLTEQLCLNITYQTEHFDEKFIKRFGQHLKVALQWLMERSNQLTELYLLTEGEDHQILAVWNNTERSFPKDKTVHQLFEEQVAKTPDNIAVVFEEVSLTYRELNEKANRVAHHLREQGVEPDSLVAIACERSLEMIIGILAILKAGGAYVPIDPSYPQERIQFMLEDIQATLLLTQQDILKELPRTKAKLILLDEGKGELENYPITNPSSTAQPHHLAYVIYTSGSTGKPKGVMVEHISVVNTIFSLNSVYDFAKGNKVAAFASYVFDVSISEFLTSLLRGGILYLLSNAVRSDPTLVARYITDHHINYIYLPPVVLANLPKGEYPTLCGIVYAGEPCDLKTGKYWSSNCNLYNYYGPTETTIYATGKRVEDGDVHLIGKPIPNIYCYVLDPYLNPVPIGIPGELYIAGVGLARGYLNQPDLTAERFINNPFQTEEEKAQGKNGRLYKTGDLCRWREDGNIEYLGRRDDQVKIRGFRIELGEIEAALLQYPAIRSAAVIVREDTLADKRLVGYIVPKGKTLLEAAVLRAHLQALLPEHMVPSAFVMLDEVPLTANGKLDRKALPAPEYQADEKAYVAPRTEVEKILCEMWQEVLRVSKVGIHDNFFESGGHSLSLMQLASKIQNYFSKNISIDEIYNSYTVAKQAAYLNGETNDFTAPNILSLCREGNQQPLFLIHPGSGLSSCYSSVVPYLRGVPLYGVSHPAFLGIDIKLSSVEDMAAYYIKMIKMIRPKGPYRLGGWSFGGMVAHEMACQLLAGGETVEKLLLIDAYHPNLVQMTEEINKIENADFEFNSHLLKVGVEPNSVLGITIKRMHETAKDLIQTYKPKYYAGSASLLKGVTQDANFLIDLSSNGWEECVSRLSVSVIDEKHYDFFDPSAVEKVASWMSKKIMQKESNLLLSV